MRKGRANHSSGNARDSSARTSGRGDSCRVVVVATAGERPADHDLLSASGSSKQAEKQWEADSSGCSGEQTFFPRNSRWTYKAMAGPLHFKAYTRRT